MIAIFFNALGLFAMESDLDNLIPNLLSYSDVKKAIKQGEDGVSVESIIEKVMKGVKEIDKPTRVNAELKAYEIYISQSEKLKQWKNKISQHVELNSKDNVVNSFEELVNWLDEKEYNYALNMYTFGTDGETIRKFLEKKGKKVDFSGEFKEHNLNIENQTYSTHKAIYNKISQNGIHLLQADYDFWQKNHNQNGKLFIQDPQNIDMFFDDNAYDLSKKRTIVSAPGEGEKIENSNVDKVLDLIKEGKIINVNFMEALCDCKYFIKKTTEIYDPFFLSFTKKLVLNLDINGTVLMGDREANMTPEKYAEKILLKAVDKNNNFLNKDVEKIFNK